MSVYVLASMASPYLVIVASSFPIYYCIMKNNPLIYNCLLCAGMLFSVSALYAQSISSSVYGSAGSATDDHYKLSYTIGETMVRTFDKYGYTLEEGFQRALNTDTADGLAVLACAQQESLICYPNPATHAVNILYQVAGAETSDMMIYTLTGQFVRAYTVIPGEVLSINIADMPSGNYMVRVQASGDVGGLVTILCIQK